MKNVSTFQWLAQACVSVRPSLGNWTDSFLITEHGMRSRTQSRLPTGSRSNVIVRDYRNVARRMESEKRATIAADEGATSHELKAMFGWLTLNRVGVDHGAAVLIACVLALTVIHTVVGRKPAVVVHAFVEHG
jgi:hypothetical protein